MEGRIPELNSWMGYPTPRALRCLHLSSSPMFFSEWGEIIQNVSKQMNRNVRKCLSAQDLWGLQESRQRERWSSEKGQQIWSTFREYRGSVEPERTREWGNELRDLVWKGIPGNMREEAYMLLSGEEIGNFFVGRKTFSPVCHMAAEISKYTLNA